MALPIVCICYHEMAKRLPRVLVPYYRNGPRSMSPTRRIRIPRTNDGKYEFHASDEVMNKADPPPKYEPTAV